MAKSYTKKEVKEAIERNLSNRFGLNFESASKKHIFIACAAYLRSLMSMQNAGKRESGSKESERQVHYMSMEFLIGRSLAKNAYNLGVLGALGEVLADLHIDVSDFLEIEPDAGLGNGGLGRLAACYLESGTTLDIPITGYSICYEYGIFKQKIIDGMQVELPDNWLESGDVWLSNNIDQAEEIRFGGTLGHEWEDGQLTVKHENYTTVLAVPRDMLISGYNTNHINALRLWSAKSPTEIDMSLFSRGEYLKAMEQNTMAEVIAKVLYPEDNHYEGKSLRLKQQYFFLSATAQSIMRRHKNQYKTLENFHKVHVVHINDTHPSLIIPEMMRILLDVEGYEWNKAWNIVSKTVTYTNHTVMSEALERWPQGIIETLLPRIWDILCEINRRYCEELESFFINEPYKIADMAIIWDGEVRMANLCVSSCYNVNGVSQLHTEILKNEVFKDEYIVEPFKFKNITNGIDHRRWLAQINPELHELLAEHIGKEYLMEPSRLADFAKYAGNSAVKFRLGQIKRENKLRLVEYVEKESGIILNPDSIFDVQAKRLHEYKRQLLNIMHIIYLYNQILDDPDISMQPRTFIFGAKAAPGYHMAKRIIQLINSLSHALNADARVRDRLSVVFLENYRVSLADKLMPAAEVSEQISLAGKEASGTGNMKFMLNGAVTIGTLDGANVEMHEELGGKNIFIFGLKAEEVAKMKQEGSYNPSQIYMHNPDIRRVLEMISGTWSDGNSYTDIANMLFFGTGGHIDEYMLLADFESYKDTHALLASAYADRSRFNEMSAMNIACAGKFAADRSMREYADKIWHVKYK